MTTRGARPDWEPITLSGDESGRDRLVLEHIPLLKHIVGRMLAPAGVERDDLYGIGMLGLIAAADSWDASRGLKFSTYAYHKVRARRPRSPPRSEEHTSELQSQFHLVCRLLLEKKKA